MISIAIIVIIILINTLMKIIKTIIIVISLKTNQTKSFWEWYMRRPFRRKFHKNQ